MGGNDVLFRRQCHFPAGSDASGLPDPAKKTARLITGTAGTLKAHPGQPKRGDQILWDPDFGILLGVALPWSGKLFAASAAQERGLEADRAQAVECRRL
jgi:hypothetical protein